TSGRSRPCVSDMIPSFFAIEALLFPVHKRRRENGRLLQIFLLQTSLRQHLSQCGAVLAVHTSLPWYTRRWQKSLPSSGGMIFHRAISTFFGSLILSTRPIRLLSRIQCVSVTM